MSTLQVGKIIYAAITTNTALNTVLEGKVYPLAAPADTTFPFVVYNRTNVYSKEHTKDGWLTDDCSFQITVVSDKYTESVDIADNIRDLFENCQISYSYLTINNTHLTSSNEMFNEDEYIQNLYFECESNL